MLHNIDTLGANVDAALLGLHIERDNGLTCEVITRRLEDRGGGLARVNETPRLVEGLAMPHEQDEFKLSYYNSMTTWIHIDKLLSSFGLTRAQLDDQAAIDKAVREMSFRMPTYITLKERKETLGQRARRCLPGLAIRETVERYDVTWRPQV